MTALCSLESITDVMLCKDGIEELNVVAFRSWEAVAELFGLRFFSSTLLLCHSWYGDLYCQTSKYRSCEERLRWLWTARIAWWHGRHLSVCLSQCQRLSQCVFQCQTGTNMFFFTIPYRYAKRCKQYYNYILFNVVTISLSFLSGYICSDAC
jgi:hypothetical protein